MITLEKFQAHIVLYCKGHYNVKDVDFLVGLRRIWAVRCGLSVEHISRRADESIADEMYRILEQTIPQKMPYLYQGIHRDIANNWKFGNLLPLECLIMMYKNEIHMTQTREKINKNYQWLIKLPKPQKRLFKRIVNGKGEYNDYNSVK